MESEDEGPSRDELKEFFEVGVHFLGQDWLMEKHREFYGEDSNNHRHQKSPPEVVSQFKRGLEEFGYEEPKAPEILSPDELSEPTLRMVNLGRYLVDLDEAETYYSATETVESGLPSSLQNRLRNDDEWEKAMFEIQIAAGYSREGLPVQLIEEGDVPEADVRVPLDIEVYIECKRVNSLPGSAQDRRGVTETLFKSAASRINREGIAIFELSAIPSNTEAGNVTHHLPPLSNPAKEQHIDLPYGTLHVFPYLEPGTIKEVPKAASQDILQWTEFVNIEVQPVLQTKLNITQEELDNATLETNAQAQNGFLRYRDPLFMGVLVDGPDDFIQPVLNQFQSSLKKFDDGTVNILHIDIPNMFNKMDLEDVQEIKRRVGGLLWRNEKVTAFHLSTENIQHGPTGNIMFGHAMAHMLNKNRSVDPPEELELLGLPMEEFEEQISTE